MQALRWHGSRDLRLEDVEASAPLEAGMVEAQVHFCGICGSDVTEFRDGPFAIQLRPHVLTGRQPPVTLGHEFSATVTAIGPGVGGISPGDRVAADACWRCGRCEACVSGNYNLCARGGAIGLASDGGFAERVRFPAYCVVPLPAGVSNRAGALLEPLAVALHSLERGNARPGDVLVVIGFGPIGAAVALVGRSIGLTTYVLELTAPRRARAEHMAVEVVIPAETPRDTERLVRARTGGGAHLVVDASGSASVAASALEMTRRGGSVVVTGIPKQLSEVSLSRLVLYERSLVGALGYHQHLPRVAALIDSGQLDPTPLVTRVVPLGAAAAEIERLATDPGDDLKVLVEVTAHDH